MLFPQLSPNQKYIAYCINQNINIFTINFEETFCIKFKEELCSFKWSPDSLLLLGVFKENNYIKVWRLDDLSWNCKIFQTLSGFDEVLWAPDSRYLLVVMDKLCRVTVWSLINKNTIFCIKDLKCYISKKDQKVKNCQENNYRDILSFSHSGYQMACIENISSKHGTIFSDRISIYAVQHNEWKLEKIIQTNSKDIQGFIWSPDDIFICVSQQFFMPLLYIFDVEHNELIATIDSQAIFANPTVSIKIESPSLNHIKWSKHSSSFILLQYFPQHLVMLNSITWNPIFNFRYPQALTNNSMAVIHEETLVKESIKLDHLNLLSISNGEAKEEVAAQNRTSPTAQLCWENKYQIVTERPYNLIGNTYLQQDTIQLWLEPKFSFDNRYLATHNDQLPNAIYVWSLKNGELLHVLLHKLPIYDFKWNPRKNVLAICNGSNRCFFWTPSTCAVYREDRKEFLITHPQGFNNTTSMLESHDNQNIDNKYLDININKLCWSKSGNKLFAFSPITQQDVLNNKYTLYDPTLIKPSKRANAIKNLDIPFRVIQFTKKLWKEISGIESSENLTTMADLNDPLTKEKTSIPGEIKKLLDIS